MVEGKAKAEVIRRHLHRLNLDGWRIKKDDTQTRPTGFSRILARAKELVRLVFLKHCFCL